MTNDELLKLTLVFFGEDLGDGGWAERLLLACKLIGELVSVCLTVGVGDFRFRISDQDFALVLRDVVRGYELLEPDGFLVGQGGSLHLVGIFRASVVENAVALAVRLAVLHLLLYGGDGVQLRVFYDIESVAEGEDDVRRFVGYIKRHRPTAAMHGERHQFAVYLSCNLLDVDFIARDFRIAISDGSHLNSCYDGVSRIIEGNGIGIAVHRLVRVAEP